ncbi:MAG: hypothetical protein GY746_02795, partial [Gammaproteobacteria bacterium]|nr:hypothetical protein [Gammaproteobacteria bacterium]
VEGQYEEYIDLILPTSETLASGWIYLEARGADGGRRYYNGDVLFNNHYANGGEGAILGGWAKIDDNVQGCIPSGSKIRFIIGEHGKSYNNYRSPAGAGGGGGTGILFLPPNAGNGEWQHLIIAGAGGGAYGDYRIKKNGEGGHAGPDKPSGEAGKGSNPGKAAGWKYGTAEADSGYRLNYENWADWVKIKGQFKDISVGGNGTVWGVDLNNIICRRKTDDSDSEKVSGAFKQVSVATDGTVWGVNRNNEIYRMKDDNDTWEMIPTVQAQNGWYNNIHIVQLSHGSASSDVWGVNSNNEIYRKKDGDSTWVRIPGALAQISHGSDSAVWGVNSKDEIYRRNKDDSAWEKVPGALKQVTVAADGTVWGINRKGEIYRRKVDDERWIKLISDSNIVFKTVSAGRSSNIWALDKNGDIYYYNSPSDYGLTPIGGKGGSDGRIYGGWGYGGGGAGWDSNAGSGGGSCGGSLRHSKAGGGGYSWMNGEYISMEIIRKDGRSGGSPRKHPKNDYAKYEIVDSDTPFIPWVKVDGKLSDISVADDGTVWGIDSNNVVYRRNADDSA